VIGADPRLLRRWRGAQGVLVCEARLAEREVVSWYVSGIGLGHIRQAYHKRRWHTRDKACVWTAAPRRRHARSSG
jgi:hypothetical protein